MKTHFKYLKNRENLARSCSPLRDQVRGSDGPRSKSGGQYHGQGRALDNPWVRVPLYVHSISELNEQTKMKKIRNYFKK